MSRHGEITVAWGDGDYTFRLGYGELLLLQQSCDAGPDYIGELIQTSQCRVDHVREVLRLSLIGGGMKQSEALAKVRTFYEQQMEDYDNNRLLAYVIIAAALRPVGEKLGKILGAVKAKSSGSRKAKSTSSVSSASPPQSQPSGLETSTA